MYTLLYIPSFHCQNYANYEHSTANSYSQKWSYWPCQSKIPSGPGAYCSLHPRAGLLALSGSSLLRCRSPTVVQPTAEKSSHGISRGFPPSMSQLHLRRALILGSCGSGPEPQPTDSLPGLPSDLPHHHEPAWDPGWPWFPSLGLPCLPRLGAVGLGCCQVVSAPATRAVTLGLSSFFCREPRALAAPQHKHTPDVFL